MACCTAFFSWKKDSLHSFVHNCFPNKQARRNIGGRWGFVPTNYSKQGGGDRLCPSYRDVPTNFQAIPLGLTNSHEIKSHVQAKYEWMLNDFRKRGEPAAAASQVLSCTLKYISMTSLLTHTVAHSTRPSFRPKTNYQPLKKFLSLAIFYVKNYPNLSTFFFFEEYHIFC